MAMAAAPPNAQRRRGGSAETIRLPVRCPARRAVVRPAPVLAAGWHRRAGRSRRGIRYTPPRWPTPEGCGATGRPPAGGGPRAGQASLVVLAARRHPCTKRWEPRGRGKRARQREGALRWRQKHRGAVRRGRMTAHSLAMIVLYFSGGLGALDRDVSMAITPADGRQGEDG